MPSSTSGASCSETTSPCTGHGADLDVVENLTNEKFTRKVEGRLGRGSEDAQEAKLLSRMI
eukprot:4218393-Alexandrium_andersonii.AAC.1